ncbi:2-haloalkanoic acid dehalogenase, type II [Shewanella psychrophila]|uniref:(S)-2-haloacid dehalogenase n=1 Tax=Shewanella psychrophila TaxID=225848 RepID=A0A1S6HWG9_9GAMM|nr:haloacid dehalogenase type II [Shewanella psychrophila]AQS39893.1 2-haloalkanoic acid dehalogenase, type II [Shewanella psychrophila]
MKLTRSAIMLLGLTTLPSMASTTEKSINTPQVLPKVIFFDVNETLLDLDNVAKSVTQALEGRDDLVNSWFTTMLHYSLVSNAIGEYHHFGDIGVAALQLVAKQNGIALSQSEANQAIQAPFRDLQPHLDVIKGLKQLQAQGIKLVTLTNSSDAGIESQLKNAHLTQYFDDSLTVQHLQVFKPDLRVYRWALEQMQVEADEAMLIAAHTWDIAGAAKVGMQTGFIQRPGQYQFALAEKADYVAADLIKLSEQVLANQP